MKNCSNCFWCRIAFNTKYIYKCKMGKQLLFVGRNIEIDTNKILGIYQRNDIYACGMYVIEYVNEDGGKDAISIHPSTFKSIKVKR